MCCEVSTTRIRVNDSHVRWGAERYSWFLEQAANPDCAPMSALPQNDHSTAKVMLSRDVFVFYQELSEGNIIYTMGQVDGYTGVHDVSDRVTQEVSVEQRASSA